MLTLQIDQMTLVACSKNRTLLPFPTKMVSTPPVALTAVLYAESVRHRGPIRETRTAPGPAGPGAFLVEIARMVEILTSAACRLLQPMSLQHHHFAPGCRDGRTTSTVAVVEAPYRLQSSYGRWSSPFLVRLSGANKRATNSRRPCRFREAAVAVIQLLGRNARNLRTHVGAQS
jgi:hypothetical protein